MGSNIKVMVSVETVLPALPKLDFSFRNLCLKLVLVTHHFTSTVRVTT